MWMMGCNDDGKICLPTNNDSFNSGRKFRPLIPRPPPPNPGPNSPDHDGHHNHTHHHGRLNHSHGLGIQDPGHGFFPLNHHHLVPMAEQSKREFHTAHQVVVSSRWNPTPEQLRTLEDLYRHGTRTPSADQIQQITSQLRRYGKIEGKNVFYWFQNHKARERQKRRRQMESFGLAEDENGYLSNHRESGNAECKESGGSRKTVSDDDVQRANNNNIPTTINNNDNVNNSYNWGCAEGSNIDRGGKSAMAAEAAAVVGGGGGGSASGSSSAAAAAAEAVKTTSTSSASSTAVVTSLWMKLNESSELLLPYPNMAIPYDDEAFVLAKNATCPRRLAQLPTTATVNDLSVATPLPSAPLRPLPFPNQDFQTLQLFPLRSEADDYDEGYDKGMERGVDFAGGCHVGEEDHLRLQFYEFLPMKN
ncbi:hypothetical protein MLD38_038278 [Melastoma candidum]|uniref:Uncharacterized protein n=1 Tax=Melastoma candidum TaxID=119954 RepID=A0ACB9KZL0_9MYRT|nr:hypothetical protein MLD38_038278 [Melastoma candidum]